MGSSCTPWVSTGEGLRTRPSGEPNWQEEGDAAAEAVSDIEEEGDDEIASQELRRGLARLRSESPGGEEVEVRMPGVRRRSLKMCRLAKRRW